MTALVSDVGGTSIRFALADRSAKGVEIHHFAKWPGDDFTCYCDALTTYLDEVGQKPEAGLFALAGPVVDEAITLLNRPEWPPVRLAEIRKRMGIDTPALINDFAAMARFVPEMGSEDCDTLIEGEARADAPIVVCGPGTGFGVATLLPEDDGRWRVASGEGGHSAFAPMTELDVDVRNRLKSTFGFVSNEIILAGKHMQSVLNAVFDVHGRAHETLSPADVIARASAGDEACLDLCRLRARGTLRFAGDLAMISGAKGGVALAGGVSQRLAAFLRESEALSAFTDRGQRSDYMEGISLKLITNERAALIGAGALHFDKGRVS